MSEALAKLRAGTPALRLDGRKIMCGTVVIATIESDETAAAWGSLLANSCALDKAVMELSSRMIRFVAQLARAGTRSDLLATAQSISDDLLCAALEKPQ